MRRSPVGGSLMMQRWIMGFAALSTYYLLPLDMQSWILWSSARLCSTADEILG